MFNSCDFLPLAKADLLRFDLTTPYVHGDRDFLATIVDSGYR